MSIRLEREDRLRRQRDLESMHRERRRVELQELQHLRHRLQVCTDVISNTLSNLPPLCWPACCRWIWSTKGRCEVTPEPWWSEGAVKGAVDSVLLRPQGLSPLSWKIRFPTFWKVGSKSPFLWVGHLFEQYKYTEKVGPLRSSIKMHPYRKVHQIPILSGNESDPRVPLKPSFSPRGPRT